MAVFRVQKTQNYTVMSNYHLNDKALSLKAKGLLSLMLSLPDSWDYTTRGLASICKEGVDGIRATVRELENAGYIIRRRVRDQNGQVRGIYDYGKPFKREAPGSQKQYGFCIPPMQPGTTVAVFEAAIDAMAEMTLCGDAADKYRLSLGGISSSGKEPLALQEFLRQHPEITTIELRMDNDAKGRMASVGIRKIYADRYAVHDLPPNIENGDYADMAKNNLMARTAAHRAALCR